MCFSVRGWGLCSGGVRGGGGVWVAMTLLDPKVAFKRRSSGRRWKLFLNFRFTSKDFLSFKRIGGN